VEKIDLKWFVVVVAVVILRRVCIFLFFCLL